MCNHDHILMHRCDAHKVAFLYQHTSLVSLALWTGSRLSWWFSDNRWQRTIKITIDLWQEWRVQKKFTLTTTCLKCTGRTRQTWNISMLGNFAFHECLYAYAWHSALSEYLRSRPAFFFPTTLITEWQMQFDANFGKQTHCMWSCRTCRSRGARDSRNPIHHHAQTNRHSLLLQAHTFHYYVRTPKVVYARY